MYVLIVHTAFTQCCFYLKNNDFSNLPHFLCGFNCFLRLVFRDIGVFGVCIIISIIFQGHLVITLCLRTHFRYLFYLTDPSIHHDRIRRYPLVRCSWIGLSRHRGCATLIRPLVLTSQVSIDYHPNP